jgi:CheY-like chemotaxis protein
MDLMMQMRAIANIPGIAISGFGNNGDIERSLQAGFSDHLIKPIKLDNLEAAMERALAQADASAGKSTAAVSSSFNNTAL